ncbi:hypothetical protein ACFRAQ_34680 [Nocardia sp. NPDC056611]|uniref:hypothetical protein n=1 Tax=Nocardia sp. NPDC056611 TaxID=3345877 RepID=UPI00366E36ED
MAIDYEVEEDLSFAEIMARRRESNITAPALSRAIREAKLREDFQWLEADDLPFETITKRLGRDSPKGLAVSLREAGIPYREPDRREVDQALDEMIAKGTGYTFDTADLPEVGSTNAVSNALRAASNEGLIRRLSPSKKAGHRTSATWQVV